METTQQLIKDKEVLIEKQKQDKTYQDAKLAQISPEMALMEVQTMKLSKNVVRNFVHCYSIIYCNEWYDELRKIQPGLADLEWVQNDLRNARATVDMMQIKPENRFELIDATSDQISAVDLKLAKLILAHGKAKELVFVYAYVAGHGCANVRQYLILNSSNPAKTMYNVEEQLRMRSMNG